LNETVTTHPKLSLFHSGVQPEPVPTFNTSATHKLQQ